MSTNALNISKAFMPYDVTGSGDGFPIVLVPGGLSGWVSWKPHAEILSRKHKVIRVQLLNMAAAERKETPGDGYSLRSESEALKKTLDRLGILKVNLVGWSHGGEVSLDFALNYPGRINKLCLIEPATYWVAKASLLFEDEISNFYSFLKRIHDPVTEEDLIQFLRRNGLVPPGTDPRSMPRWPIWNSLKISLLSLHTVIEHGDDISRLGLLRGKNILLVKGRESEGFNSGVIDILASAFGPNAKTLILPDSHASHIVAQDQFIEELERFLSS